MKNIFSIRWFFVILFCCIGYWGQSQGLVTANWKNIGAQNAKGDFPIIAIGKSDTIYAVSAYTTVNKISPAGTVTTDWLTSSDLTSGSTVDVSGISVNKTSGDVYVLYKESSIYKIAKITPDKTITKPWATLTGGSTNGFSFIRIDNSTGDVYVLNNNTSIDKISSGGTQTTLKTLTNTPSYAAADASGNMFLQNANGSISKVISSGTETTSWGTFTNSVGSVPPVTDASGNVYVVEVGAVTNLLKFSSSGGSPALTTSLGSANVRGISIDASANVYLLSDVDNTIIKVTSSGTKTTFAQLPIDNYSSSRGSMVVDASNNIYALNTGEGGNGGSDVITKITSGGTVTSKWADMAVPYPMGITRDNSGNLFVANTKNNTVSKISSSGTVTTAWSSLPVGTHPLYIVADNSGNVFTSNRNNTISKINSSGTATSIAVGSAYTAYFTANDAGPIALDNNGNLYVGIKNGSSSSIVKIASGGTSTTTWANLTTTPDWIAVDNNTNILYAVNQTSKMVSKIDLANSNTGTNTTASWVTLSNGPVLIAVDAASGNVYTVNNNSTVSKITSLGVLTQSFATLSGTSPVAIYAGSNGSIYVLDDFYKSITRVKTDGTTEQIVSSSDGLSSVSVQKAGMVFDNASTFYLTTNQGGVARVQIRPTVNTVTIASDNAITSKAKLGNKVTVNFTSSEAINTPTATIAGTAATVTNVLGSTSWKAEVTIGTSNTTGTVAFTISNITNSSTGVSGTDVTATTNSSQVVIDTITPTLNPVTIVSNNTNNTAKAKIGDKITLNFTSSEVINTPTVTIGSGTATVTNLSGSTSWKAELTMSSSNTQAQGQIVFSIAISDLTGNTRTVTTTTDNSKVTYDTLPPRLTTVSIASNGSTSNVAGPTDSVTITFIASEALGFTPTVSVKAGGQTIHNPVQVHHTTGNNWNAGFYMDQTNDITGAITFTITNVKDTTGNVDSTVTTPTNGTSVTFVKSKPALTSVTIASNNATNTRRATTGNTVTVNFTASEAIKTPVVKLTTLQRSVTATNTLGDKINWQATYTTLVGDPEDSVTILIIDTSIYNIAGDQVRATTNRSYVLFDKTNPTLSSVSIVSNNPVNTARATTGDSVTISFTASEALSQKPSVSIAGHVLSQSSITNISGNNWKSGYRFTGTETEGTVQFNISYIDSAGLSGTAVTTTTNNSRVIYDKTNPTLSSVAIISNNPVNTARATTGDSVTVSFTASEALSQKPNVSIAGQVIPSSSVTNISGNNWKGVYKLAGTETEDTVRFNISYIDSSGLSGTAVTATTDNSRVIYDKTKPVLSGVAIISNNSVNTARAATGDSVTVSFTASEALSQKPSVSIAGQVIPSSSVTNISGNNWKGVYRLAGTETEDTVRFYVSFIDSVGNKGDTVRTTNNNSRVIYDKTKPLLSSVAIVSNNAANTARATTGDSVTVSFTASEVLSQKPNVSIAGQVIAASGVTNISGNNWKVVYKFTGTETEDTVRFYVSFIDSAGNKGDTVRTTTNSSSVVFDKTAPALTTVSILSNNINSNTHATTGDSITLSFTSAEPIVSPSVIMAGQAIVSANVINVSGNNWKAVYKMQSGDAEGNISFLIAYKDAIGNPDTVRNTTTNNTKVIFDKTPPVLTAVAIASNASDPAIGLTNSVITLSFTASEGILTPAATIAGHTLTPTVVSGNSWKATYTLQATDTEGQIPFTITYKDSAGIAGGLVDTTTNRSKVVFDKSALVLNIVSISSNNSTDTSHATTGDIITIKFKSSREINTPTVLLAGRAVTATNGSGDKINWKASYTMQATDAEGVTALKVDFSDLAGNLGLTATGTSDNTRVIFDKTPPTLSSIGILSSNANTAKAKVGDTIKLNIVSGEGIITPVVTISGSSASVTYVSGNNWKASYIMQSTDTEGNIPFSISYKDSAGLSGTVVTATTNNSAVVFDKTAPILSSVSVISNNANTTKAKVGDTVTLSFTPNEGALTPVVTISGQTANVTRISGNNWKASYAMQATDAEGNIPFNIAFKDSASNSGIAVTTTMDNSSVLFDRTPPQLTSVSIASNDSVSASKAAIGDLIAVSFTSSEVLLTPVVTISGQTVSVTLVSGNNWKASYTMRATDVEGSIPFTIAYKDAASNTGNTVTATTDKSSVLFDRTAPKLTSVSIASNNGVFTGNAIAGDQVTVSFESDEAIRPPVVTIAGHDATVTNASGDKIRWKASYTMIAADTEGGIPFSIAFKDVLSNTGTTVTTTSDNSKVIFDKTAPVLTSVSIRSNNSVTGKAKTGNQVTLSFVSSESIQPPVVSIAGHTATATGSGRNWSATYTLVNTDVEGNISFTIAFKDSSGIAGTSVSAVTDGSNVVFDRTAPALNSISFSSNNADKEKAQPGDVVTVNFASNEALLTPTISIVGRSVNASNVSGNNWTASYTMTSRDEADVQSYSIVYYDLAGNKGITGSASSTVTSICPTSFPYSWNNNQFKDTGHYSVKLFNSEGTDSTAVLVLRFNPVPAIPVISRSANSFCTGDSILLQSSAASNNQWILNGTDIAGAKSKFLYTKELGLNTYTVRVTNNLNCYSISTPVTTQYLSTVGTKLPIHDTMVCKAIVVPVTVSSIETVKSYSWTSMNTGFTASTQTVGLVNQDRYSVTVVLNNGCIITDTINFKTTADTAIKARMVMSQQGFVNQQIEAVNLTNPVPQTQVWVVPTGAGVVSNTPNELVVRFANPGTYPFYLNNTSYNICKSSDTAIIVITSNDSTNVSSNNKTIIRNLTIGPNPTPGPFRINVELNRPGKTSVRIYDWNGTPVYQKIYQEATAKFSGDIDISSQPSQRTYVLIVQTDDGYEVRTIIKK